MIHCSNFGSQDDVIGQLIQCCLNFGRREPISKIIRAFYKTDVAYLPFLVCLCGCIYVQQDYFLNFSALSGYYVEKTFGVGKDLNWYKSFQDEHQLLSNFEHIVSEVYYCNNFCL